MTRLEPTQAEQRLIRRLMPEIREGYRLRWLGTHGASHWARVLLNGLTLCDITGADVRIVTAFSIFHDSRRQNDLHDPPHGRRGGRLAMQLLSDNASWNTASLELLREACHQHTAVKHHENVTIQTCWDSDRLDLPRIGAVIDPDYLGPWATQHPNIIEAASQRAREKAFPYSEIFA